MDITIVGAVVFFILAAIVFGGFLFYRRNIDPGFEGNDPDEFTQ